MSDYVALQYPTSYRTGTYSGSSFSYNELYDGTAKYSIDLAPKNRSLSATKIFIANFADNDSFYHWIAYQEHPILLGAYAMSIAFEGFGKPLGEDDWPLSKWTIGYKNLAYSPSDNKEVQYSTGSEDYSWDKGGTQFDNGSGAVNQVVPNDPHVLLKSTECKVILHNQTSFNSSAADALIGQINAATFSPDGVASWAADQVLYCGYDVDEKYVYGNVINYEITHKFTRLPYDWRMQFNPATGAYEKIMAKAGSQYIFTEGDFSTLGIP